MEVAEGVRKFQLAQVATGIDTHAFKLQRVCRCRKVEPSSTLHKGTFSVGLRQGVEAPIQAHIHRETYTRPCPWEAYTGPYLWGGMHMSIIYACGGNHKPVSRGWHTQAHICGEAYTSPCLWGAHTGPYLCGGKRRPYLWEAHTGPWEVLCCAMLPFD